MTEEREPQLTPEHRDHHGPGSARKGTSGRVQVPRAGLGNQVQKQEPLQDLGAATTS